MTGEGLVPHVKMVRPEDIEPALLLDLVLVPSTIFFFTLQIRIAALNAASTAADESQDPQRTHKSRTKEAQVRTERVHQSAVC